MDDGNIINGVCKSCGTVIHVAYCLRCGEIVYCEQCGSAYVLISRYPGKFQPIKERHLDMPWLDKANFV